MEDVTDFMIELGNLVLKAGLPVNVIKNIIPADSATLNEQILFKKIGKFWNQQNKLDRPDGLVIVTSQRLIFLIKIRTILTKTDYLSIPFNQISNIEKKKIWLITPAIEFIADNKLFIFTFLTSKGIDEIIGVMNLAKTNT